MAIHVTGMTSLLVLVLLCTVRVSFVSADQDEPHNVYNDAMFEHATTQSAHFIMFFAPWCGHCKKLTPVWDELGERFNRDDSVPATFAKVDCTAETKICHANGVKGYPTLKFFKPGMEPVKYTGKRDFASLEKFMEEQLNTEKKDVPQPPEAKHGLYELTVDTFKDHVAKGNHFVKFYAPWCGHCKKLAPVWEQLADGFSHNEGITISKIDCTAHRPVCVEHGVSGFPTLKFFKDGDMVDTYKGVRDHQALKVYVSQMMAPPADQAQPTKEVPKEEKKVEEKKEEATDAEVKDSKVVDLTADSFLEGVSKGITLVEFFAPWCGHCKRLAPAYEELAQQLDDKPVLTAARVDCTVHKGTCSKYDVKGYPTLLLFKNGKYVEKYSGGRTQKDMYSFLLRKLHEMQKEEL